jgi:hypothetical protein
MGAMEKLVKLVHDKFEKFEETPETVKKACEIIRAIQEKYKDELPHARFQGYVDTLERHYRYAYLSAGLYTKARAKGEKFERGKYLNMSKFWIKGKGACEQYAIALAMLCYNDPAIDCYQMPVEFIRDGHSDDAPDWYKHSANYVTIARRNPYQEEKKKKIYCEGVVDFLFTHGRIKPIDIFMDDQIELPAGHGRVEKVLGMAYYERGHKLEDIFMEMQKQGSGIKFDFDKYIQSKEGEGLLDCRDAFKQAYNQKQLSKTIARQQETVANLENV